MVIWPQSTERHTESLSILYAILFNFFDDAIVILLKCKQHKFDLQFLESYIKLFGVTILARSMLYNISSSKNSIKFVFIFMNNKNLTTLI